MKSREVWKKMILLGCISLLLISAAAATTFGTMTSDQDKQVSDNEGWFHVDVINMGDEPLAISVEADSTDPDTEVRFRVPGSDTTGFRTFVKGETEPTSNPEGDHRWFALGNGEYVPVSRIDIRAIVDGEADYDTTEFTVRVSARPTEEQDEGSDEVDPRQEVVQVREYDFTLATDGTDLDGGERIERERGLIDDIRESVPDMPENILGSESSGTESGSTGLSAQEVGDVEESSDPDVTVEDSDGSDNFESQSSESSDSEIDEEYGQTSENQVDDRATGNFLGQVGSTTVILTLGLMASVFYLVKVM